MDIIERLYRLQAQSGSVNGKQDLLQRHKEVSEEIKIKVERYLKKQEPVSVQEVEENSLSGAPLEPSERSAEATVVVEEKSISKTENGANG